MKKVELRRSMMTAILLLTICGMTVADEHERVDCLVDWTPPSFVRSGLTRSGVTDIAYGDRGWDANRTYRQLVVLVSFSDCDFSLEDPKSAYDAMLNMPGYTQRDGAGYVADCFRDQSNGVFNLQFDVYNKGGQEHCAISAHLFYSQ